MRSEKPFNNAAENNKKVILQELLHAFKSSTQILEIGSGTGQHAVFFAPAMPHLTWQCSDQPHYHAGINAWIDHYPSDNLLRPIELTVNENIPCLHAQIDGVYTANTAHIMQKQEVKQLMRLVSMLLPSGGVFCQYGPFSQAGKFSSESNASFHQSLISQGYGGYRDVDELREWGEDLALQKVINMPSNNLLLVWVKHVVVELAGHVNNGI